MIMGESLKNIELRKLPLGKLSKLVDILDTNEDWKELMCKIPKYPQNTNFEPKYNSEHVRLIENHSHKSGRKCTAILFEEWGTSGKVRPTLHTLKEILVKYEMIRAAEEIASMLNESPPQRPAYGPAASISTDVSMLLNNESTKQQSNAIDSIQKTVDNQTTAQMSGLLSDFMKFTNTFPDVSNSIFTPPEKKAPETALVDSDLIQFTNNTNSLVSHDLPAISALSFTGNESTAQIKTQSDSVQSQTSDSLLSADMPQVSALINRTEVSTKGDNTSLPAPDSSSELIVNRNTISESVSASQNINYVNSNFGYQTTFPNITFSISSKQSNSDDTIFDNKNLVNFDYEDLQKITNDFSELVTVGPNGITGKIGMGGFGEVFVGVHPRFGTLAIKKAHDELLNNRKCESTIKLFNAEVKYLSQFQHENIVPILGFSRNGPAPCLVCEFIDGGSLENKISARVLNEIQRINIMIGTAEGLKYLHKSLYDSSSTTLENAQRSKFVHGDVKSANILLTNDHIPKLCDFGLAKQYYDTTFMTTSPMGTSAYMAPEGFSGTITQKIDIYSFGIVLLELLTGLKSIVNYNKEQMNIKDYVEENITDDEITNLLDSTVPNWIKAREIYKLATACLERNRNKRLAIENVCDRLYEIRIE